MEGIVISSQQIDEILHSAERVGQKAEMLFDRFESLPTEERPIFAAALIHRLLVERAINRGRNAF